METAIIKGIAEEMRRRTCPSCGHPLSGAHLSLARDSSLLRITFSCTHCVFQGGGAVDLGGEGQISRLEMIALRAFLRGWDGFTRFW